MRKLWDKWCRMVDEHNEPLNNYVWYEEMWEPYTPIFPIIWSFIISTMITFIWAEPGTPFIDIVIRWIGIGLGSSVLMELFLVANWFAFREKKEKEDDGNEKGKTKDACW